jgi:hypothetical protein
VLRRRSAIIVSFLCSVGCSLPATTFEAYRSKAADAAAEVAAQAQTAILVTRLAGEDRTLATEVAVQLKDAETAAAGAVRSFASVQPPDARADHLRARILSVLQRASDMITRLRFEAKRGHTAAMLRLRSSLIDPARALQRLAESTV